MTLDNSGASSTTCKKRGIMLLHCTVSSRAWKRRRFPSGPAGCSPLERFCETQGVGPRKSILPRRCYCLPVFLL